MASSPKITCPLVRLLLHNTLVVLFCSLAQADTPGARADNPAIDAASKPRVVREDVVYEFTPANNGAGPMWCFGNTCVVRQGDEVFVSALHTLPDAKPLNNCVPAVLQRKPTGWAELYRSSGRTREPSPVAMQEDGSILLSENPTITDPDVYSGRSTPKVTRLQKGPTGWTDSAWIPQWDGNPAFSEHSYRSFTVDATTQEALVLQNIGYTHAEWSFRDRSGAWTARGKLAWPRENAAPVRICYPCIALSERRVFLFGVSDIVEPHPVWRAVKKELTGREWDYVFRRLYFTWSDDIRSGRFHEWVEVASRECTGGQLFPNDLHIHANGDVSLLWHENSIDTRLRDRFFPNARQQQTLQYARLRDGKRVHSLPIETRAEHDTGPIPGRGRFHVTPADDLWVVYYVSGITGGTVSAENRLRPIDRRGTLGRPISLELAQPFPSFFTNTVRAGCAPSHKLDLFGRVGNTMRYAEVQF